LEGWHDEVRVLDDVSPSKDIWAEAVVRSRRVSPSRSYLSSKLVGAIALIVVVLAASLGLGLGLTGNGHPRAVSRPSAIGGPGGLGAVTQGPSALGVEPDGMNGKSVTLNQLVADMPYAISLPNSPLANASNAGIAWVDPATHAAAIWYPSAGIEVLYGGTGVDFSGVPASEIQSIGGVQSIVVPAGVEGKFARVLVPLPGNHLVTLLSSGPVSDLTSVAATLVANS
jgi:hypothetical protein